MIGLIVDSGTNVPELLVQRYQIRKVPLRIILGKSEYRDDGVEITEDQLLNYMQTSYAKTTLPSYDDILKCFEEMISEGYTEILAFNLSSSLSGTNNSFQLIAKKVMKQYTHVKIEAFDSLTVSIGTGLLVYKAAKMIAENPELTLDELMKFIKSIYQTKNQVFFVVPTLKYLIAGGRIGKVIGTIGELMKVKPILTVSKEGSLHQLGKEMGMKRAIEKIITYAKNFIGEQEVEAICIYHSGKSQETLDYTKRIQDALSILKIPEIFTGTITSTLLVHGGPGLVGLGIQLKA